MNRREKLREATIEEIKSTARRQMAENGSNNLSLHAVARDMGMSAPGLYRYFANRDELVTTLIVDAYNSLADALESAANGIPTSEHGRRMRATLLAYRGWALAHPADFALIYGTPIAGYHAPESETTPAARRSLTAILQILNEAFTAGKLVLPAQLPSLPLSDPEAEGDPGVLYLGLRGWTRLHGILMLELFNHIQPLVPDTDAFFRHEMDNLLESIGL